MFSEVTWAPIEQGAKCVLSHHCLVRVGGNAIYLSQSQRAYSPSPSGQSRTHLTAVPPLYIFGSQENLAFLHEIHHWPGTCRGHGLSLHYKRIPMIPAHWTQFCLIYKDVLFNYLHVMLHFRCSTWERKAMSHCTSSSPLFSLCYFALAFLDFPSFLDLIVSLLAVPLPVFFCHVRSFPSVRNSCNTYSDPAC